MREKFIPQSISEPGKDNSLVAEIQPGVNIHKHRDLYFVRGKGYSTEMFDKIKKLIDSDQLVFISFTGPPGKGKSWFSLRLMEMLDKNFIITDSPAPPPTQDEGQVAFTRTHLKHLIGKDTPLKHYQTIMVDESHFGLGARSWQQGIQQNIINLLVAVRSKRLIFCVVALSMKQIDNYLRDYVINFQFTIEIAGIATLYERRFHKLTGDPLTKRLGMWYLPVPFGDWCGNPDCIGCEYLYEDRNTEDKRCPNPRACYERRKDEFLNSQSEDDEKIIAEEIRMTPQQIADALRDYRYDLPVRVTKSGVTIFRGRLAGFVDLKLETTRPSTHVVTEVAGILESADWWPDVVQFHQDRSQR